MEPSGEPPPIPQEHTPPSPTLVRLLYFKAGGLSASGETVREGFKVKPGVTEDGKSVLILGPRFIETPKGKPEHSTISVFVSQWNGSRDTLQTTIYELIKSSYTKKEFFNQVYRPDEYSIKMLVTTQSKEEYEEYLKKLRKAKNSKIRQILLIMQARKKGNPMEGESPIVDGEEAEKLDSILKNFKEISINDDPESPSEETQYYY